MIVSEDCMFCYLWEEIDKPGEAKFGERWVKAGQDPEKEVWKRIKDSVGVRKDLIRDGTIRLVKFWDVSDYAKKINRFYIHGKVDDKIRPHIGFRKGSTGEVHELPAGEIEVKVNRLLSAQGQDLPVAGLSQNQHDAAVNVIEAVRAGKRTIVAELCARFGKTIWSGVQIRENNPSLTVVASYVLTSFSSFLKDLSGYQQFADLVVIDCAESNYQEVIDAALQANKQVVALLSMCSGTQRQSKINYLFGQACNRLVLVDEADFGVHRRNQSLPLIQARKPDDVVILMTGTNGDKAAGIWPVDHYLSVTYPELLIEKRLGSKTAMPSKLKYFDIDPGRHDLVVDVEFYQMDLSSAVDRYLAANPDTNTDELGSWSKVAANPVRAKGLITYMVQAVFEGRHGHDELNADYQTGRRSQEGLKVAMIFLPGSTRNDDLLEVADIMSQALKGFAVIPISGAADVTNATAESTAREAIYRAQKNNQHVLLVSAGMAQRSFSIPEITELYLAYDGGDNGATIQKMSRALTPHQSGKVGRVVSLSFDANRDDKFDALWIETAQNYQRNHGIKDLKQALGDVLRTADIFSCTENGSVKIAVDDYLARALERDALDRLVGKVADLSRLTEEEIVAIASGRSEVFRAAQTFKTLKGRTRAPVDKQTRGAGAVPAVEKTMARAREVIVTIAQNIDIIRYQGGSNLDESFAVIDGGPELVRSGISEDFGVDYELIKELVLGGVINRDLLDLKFSI